MMRTSRVTRVAAIVAGALLGAVPAGATPPLGAGVIPLLDVAGVACSAGGQCLVAGQDVSAGAGVALTAAGGAAWAPAVVASPSPGGEVSAISCPSATTCYAAGDYYPGGFANNGTVWLSTTGGASWTPLPASQAGPHTDLNGISCPTTATCVAVGNDGNTATPLVVVTNDGGATWTPAKVPVSGGLNSVSCTSTSHCVAVGGANGGGWLVAVTFDGGTSWSATTFTALPWRAFSVACRTSSCVAVGDYGTLHSSDGGTTWTASLLPTTPLNPLLHGVACLAGGRCAAVGWNGNNGQALLVTTVDGGTTWTVVPGLPAGYFLQSVATRGSTGYVAVGYLTFGSGPTALWSDDAGATWSPTGSAVPPIPCACNPI
jgi:hypothetical protein